MNEKAALGAEGVSECRDPLTEEGGVNESSSARRSADVTSEAAREGASSTSPPAASGSKAAEGHEEGGDVDELTPEQEAEHRKVVEGVVPLSDWKPDLSAAESSEREVRTRQQSRAATAPDAPEAPASASARSDSPDRKAAVSRWRTPRREARVWYCGDVCDCSQAEIVDISPRLDLGYPFIRTEIVAKGSFFTDGEGYPQTQVERDHLALLYGAEHVQVSA